LIAKAALVTLILLTITGASVWEGAAALAPRGDLPEDGYYAATNSFPKNTVVDIINLETGKSIRAIVSSGLNTPGLLAVLSSEAASRIGLAPKTIGRIRMTQPQDPIAFSRFTEGLVASGDPDYNPEAMLAGDEAARAEAEAESPAPRAPAISRRPPPEPRRDETEKAGPPYGFDTPNGVDYSDYAAYSHGSIVDMEAGSPPPQEPQAPSTGAWEDAWLDDWDGRAYLGYSPDDEDSPEKTNYRIWEQGGSVGKPETQVPPEPLPARQEEESSTPSPEDSWARAWEAEAPRSQERENREAGSPWNQGEAAPGNFLAEARSSATTAGSESSARARIQAPPPPPPAPGTVEYILVPAEQRPPVRQGPDPALGPTAPAPGPSARQAPLPEPYLDESLFIDSIEKMREDRERARAAEAAKAAGERQAAEERVRAAAAAKAAEERRLAEERARAAEAAKTAEERAQAAVKAEAPADEVVVLLNTEEPQGQWVDPIADSPPAREPPPTVLVQSPEEAGEPQGPWVEPITAPPPPAQEPPPTVLVQSPEKPQGPIAALPPQKPEAPRAAPEPSPRGPATGPGASEVFSVPVNIITELEKGKYYVQLGAYRSAASVESALLKIDPKYPLNVQNSGSADTPLYRLLVGPVNLGESGALVQRFKGSGYRDAYIRSN
jgi:hypothetical protein